MAPDPARLGAPAVGFALIGGAVFWAFHAVTKNLIKRSRFSWTWARGPLLATAVAAGLFSAGPASACECSRISVEEEFEFSELVFEGVVTKGNEELDQDPEFEVLKVWKGNPPKRVTVGTYVTSCASIVRKGDRRLVFLQRDRGANKLMIDLCSRKPLVGSKDYREAVAWLSTAAPSTRDGGTPH
jgi:hypothetical protein